MVLFSLLYKGLPQIRCRKKMDMDTDYYFNFENYSSDEEEWDYVEKNFRLDPISFAEMKSPNISIVFFFALFKLNFTKTEIQFINDKLCNGYIDFHELESLGLDIEKIAAVTYLLSPKYAILHFTPDMEVLTLDGKDIQRIKACAVCSRDFTVGTEAFSLTCLHFCHKNCIVKRLLKYISCPVCHTKYEKYPKLIQKWIDTDIEATTFMYKILHRVSGLICVNPIFQQPSEEKMFLCPPTTQ